MHSLLAQILTDKRKEVECLYNAGLPGGEAPNASPTRDFKGAISGRDRIALIAEIKFASPSAGTIRRKGDPLQIARMYERAGAAAISLLTDHPYFGGDITDLPRVKKIVSLPILRKDFILDEIQVEESRFWGADAVLLIARILSAQKLENLIKACRAQGLAALTEVHDGKELELAMGCGAEIIGINNRNLDTFEVDLETTLKLAPLMSTGRIIVSESGIKGREDVEFLRKAGIHAILVGTALMKAERMEIKVGELAGTPMA